MFRLSAFADEISPDPREQLRVLRECGVRFIEFRSIHGVNVLALSDAQLSDFQTMLADEGVGLSAIGSPIGKVSILDDQKSHDDKFRRAIDIAHRFGTSNIRLFSFYRPDGYDESQWPSFRHEVFCRLNVYAELADRERIVLLHENEHNIYGDSPTRVADLFANIHYGCFKAAYDPANFVVCGYDPLDGWRATKPRLAHLHIKDWRKGEPHGRVAGAGDGQIPAMLVEAVAMNYDGFAVLEPHLRGGGATGGTTGADLFPGAVTALRQLLHDAGAEVS